MHGHTNIKKDISLFTCMYFCAFLVDKSVLLSVGMPYQLAFVGAENLR
jgi:hypothetical protein